MDSQVPTEPRTREPIRPLDNSRGLDLSPSDGAQARAVPSTERIDVLDMLRGVALMGILIMNLPTFAHVDAEAYYPPAMGNWQGLNKAVWMVNQALFGEKMMSIFSMLFGASIVLFTSRLEAAKQPVGPLYYRRTMGLLFFGLLHAYLVWHGDILVTYALCGLFVYFFRHTAPRRLLVSGILLFSLSMAFNIGMGTWWKGDQEASHALSSARAAGERVSIETMQGAERWQKTMDMLKLTPRAMEADRQAYGSGSWLEMTIHRAPTSFDLQTLGFLSWGGPRASGLMLVGMALFKLGFLVGKRSRREYLIVLIAGLGVGLPLVIAGVVLRDRHDFDMIQGLRTDGIWNYVGSLPMALAYISAWILLFQSGRLQRLVKRLSAAGRMAFSNYILQSLLCSFVFYHWGLGYYDELDRVQLLGVIALIWALELWWSPILLRVLRFGPLEWLWRSMTYGGWQPFLATQCRTSTNG